MPEGTLQSGLLVQGGQSPRKHYELAHVIFEGEAGPFAVNFVPIALLDGQLLVAAPRGVWSKAVGERVLPRGALVRAVLVEVVGASTESPEEPLEDHPGLTLWVGFLQPKWRNKLVLGGADAPTFDVWLEDEVFSEDLGTIMPFGPALASLADEHFAFMSAGSGGGGAGKPLASRMEFLEQTFQSMQEKLDRLVQGQPGGGAQDVGARPKATPRRAEARVSGGAKLVGLDPAVVASAKEAGISEEQLRLVGDLMRKDTRLQDLPAGKTRRNVLSESEEEEDELIEDEEQEAGGPPVEKAVIQLTKIVDSLAKRKQKSKGIEAIFDSIEGGVESSSSSSSSKSKAAAFKKLKTSLQENPKYIYEVVEELMDQDFAHVRAGPGLSSVETSTRAWLEHRSKLQNFPNTVRLAWQVGAIHDSLRAGRHDEARARSALLITALDQSALDSGAWTLAQEVLLEPPAPFAAFAAKKLPEPWEQSTSMLLDDRWLDVLMWRIKDRDAYLEARRRLGGKGVYNPLRLEIPGKGAGKEAAPKKGAKGGGKGGKAEQKSAGAADEIQG